MLARRILAIAMPHLLPYSLLCNASCSCVCWLIFWVCASWQPLVAADSSTSSTVESCFPGRASSPQIVTQEPRLVAEDPFGKKFQVDLSNQDSIPLLHVYGSPYELGRAHGALLKFEIQNMYFEFFRYLENLAINALHLNILPDMLARCLARLMVNFALDLTYLLTWKFTPSRYVDEMVGLADGANVNYRDVVRIQMFPELSKASCSMLGSWGSATFDTSKAGSLYQLRALDWDMTSPIIGFHTIIFFHPADGNQFAIFTWSGFIGCVTGYSGMLGVSEKVWLESGQVYSRVGMPWHFVLRDVLQFTKNIQTTKLFLESVKRTCPLFVGIGSSLQNKFVLLSYSLDAVELYDDSNFTLVTLEKPKHQPPGVVFIDKYVQPSNDPCMEDLVNNSYGVLNGTSLLKMVSVLRSGDMHIAIYDFSANLVYFSWAVMNQTMKTIQLAYKRYHVSKLLKELLQESGEETAFPKLLSWETDFEGKKIGKYLPYSNVDSFLKICKRLRLPDIDLFTPPDVVEKKDIRRVCLCIRALSKKARANQMRIPDFDNVAVTWEIIQHDKVNGIDHMELAGNKSSIINSPSTSWNKSREAFQRESGCIASREATTSSTSLDARSTLPPVMGRDMLIVKPDKDNLIMQFPHQEGNRQLSNKQATNAQPGRNSNATRHSNGEIRKARKISLWLPIFAGAVALVGVVLARRPRDTEIYEVQAGDTLSDISRRTGKTGWKKLAEMNPGIKDPNLIYPSERLKLHGQ